MLGNKKKIKSSVIGQQAEQLAVQFLISRGYRIIQQNYRCKVGELDIIAYDEQVLCFVEVRARATAEFGYPFETISVFKRQKLVRAAQWFLQEKGIEDKNCRFDVVSVLLLPMSPPQFELLKNVLELAS